MRLFSLFSLLVPTILTVPLDTQVENVIHSSHDVPRGWRKLGRPVPGHMIDLCIGLKQSKFEELEQHLYDVSDPKHERYGKHLSSKEIHRLTAPSEISCDSVHEWLEGSGISKDEIRYSPSKDWFRISLPLWKVEELLDTEYHSYGHDEHGKSIVRTTKYSLPRKLHDHIDVVQPTNFFGDWKLHAEDFKIADLSMPVDVDTNIRLSMSSTTSADVPDSCLVNPETVSLQCLREFYRTIDYTPQVPEKNSVATTNYLGEVPSAADFRTFLQENRPDVVSTYEFDTQIIANASNNQSDPGVEANLDIQLAGGFAVPTNFTTYSTGGAPPFIPDLSTPNNTNEPYLTWLEHVMEQETVPYVISTSYGEPEQTIPVEYARRVCSELAQLGARGVTLLFSSGDNGVGKSGTCVSNDGSNKRMFMPAFPASCPFVTAVGGTRDFSPERVAFDTGNGYVAGSGFSNYFCRPTYQQDVVPAYLKTLGETHQGLYNSSGRAYPDISAQSYRFLVTYQGRNIAVDGTSVASPLVGGILALVNDALIAKGKSPLGFLNPLLYSSQGAGFTDITVGSTTGCNTTGFPAVEGWDAASGFGTPQFENIRAALGV